MNAAAQNEQLSFGNLTVDTSVRRVERDGKAVRLNAKAFDLLVFLARNAGRVVSKEEILETVWAGQFVEEANLAVQVSALRRALGDHADDPRFIATIPGRGYEFIARASDPGEIVISNHRVSRMVVEETITDDDGPLVVRGRTAAGSRLPRVLAVLALLAVGGLGFWLYFTQLSKTTRAGSVEPAVLQSTKHTFSAIGGVPMFAAISPDGKSLVYVANQKGKSALRIGDIESGTSIEISPYSDRVYSGIKFGPDGKNLYFTIRDQNHQAQTLMRMSVLGGPQQELIQAVDSVVTFSPDGKDFAFIRRVPDADKSMIVIADAETGRNERVVLTREADNNIAGLGLTWSPDGRLIAFSGLAPQEKGRALFALDIGDGSVRKIGPRIDTRILNLVWLPDQSGLIVNKAGSRQNESQIWKISYPDGTIQNISNDTLGYSQVSLSISADNKLAVVPSHADLEIWTTIGTDLARARRILAGSWARREGTAGVSAAPDGNILYIAKTGDNFSVWQMGPDGGDQHQLISTEKGSTDEQINVTTDNRYLVFQSDRSGSPQIWRANRDGSDLKQLTQDGTNEEPALTPDGHTIVYSHTGDGRKTIWRTSVDSGETSQVTNDEASWPSVSPDGRSIACAWGKESNVIKKGIAVIPLTGGPPTHLYAIPPRAALYNRLIWSPDGGSILYKDETQGLWKQDLDKGKPELLLAADDFRFYHMAATATDLIYSGGVIKRDIVIFDNFR
jgi:DNA-binding winged helix-turn-helix (wHTH) protein/Tol biopolymer transport system component